MNTFIIVAGVIPPDLNKSIFDVFLFYNLSIFLQSLSLFIFLSRPSSQSVLPSLNGIKPVSAHEGSGSGRTPSAWTAACPGCLYLGRGSCSSEGQCGEAAFGASSAFCRDGFV